MNSEEGKRDESIVRLYKTLTFFRVTVTIMRLRHDKAFHTLSYDTLVAISDYVKLCFGQVKICELRTWIETEAENQLRYSLHQSRYRTVTGLVKSGIDFWYYLKVCIQSTFT